VLEVQDGCRRVEIGIVVQNDQPVSLGNGSSEEVGDAHGSVFTRYRQLELRFERRLRPTTCLTIG
jgi:hypothetical protein